MQKSTKDMQSSMVICYEKSEWTNKRPQMVSNWKKQHWRGTGYNTQWRNGSWSREKYVNYLVIREHRRYSSFNYTISVQVARFMPLLCSTYFSCFAIVFAWNTLNFKALAGWYLKVCRKARLTDMLGWCLIDKKVSNLIFETLKCPLLFFPAFTPWHLYKLFVLHLVVPIL